MKKIIKFFNGLIIRQGRYMQTDNNKSQLKLTELSMEDLIDQIEQLEALDWSDFPKFENKTRAQSRQLLIQLCWARFIHQNWN